MSSPLTGQAATSASPTLAVNSATAASSGPTTSPNTDWRKPSAAAPKEEKCLVKFAKCMAPLFKDRVIVTSSRCTIYCNFVLVALLLIIGVIIRGTANNAQEYQVRFDDKCKSGTNCVFNLLIREKMTGPIYIYLHFNNMFINHRKVMKSLNKKQLMGEDIDIDTLKTTCEGKVKNSDFPDAKTAIQGKGLPYDDAAALNPCGIFATLFPQDTFSLQKMSGSNDEVVESTLEISTSNLVYGNLKGNKFKTTDQTKNKQWTDVQQGTTGMKAPLSSNFYKLWGIVNQDLQKGNYRITISGDLGLVSTTKIQKELYFTNLTWLGGNNPFMYYAFFMVAIFLLFVGGALLYIEKLDKAEYD